MDIEVGTFEAKNKLSELLAQVERGQRIYITRRGKRVALLTAATDLAATQPTPKEVLGRFRSFRKNAKPGLESLKALIEEGRR